MNNTTTPPASLSRIREFIDGAKQVPCGDSNRMHFYVACIHYDPASVGWPPLSKNLSVSVCLEGEIIDAFPQPFVFYRGRCPHCWQKYYAMSRDV